MSSQPAAAACARPPSFDAVAAAAQMEEEMATESQMFDLQRAGFLFEWVDEQATSMREAHEKTKADVLQQLQDKKQEATAIARQCLSALRDQLTAAHVDLATDFQKIKGANEILKKRGQEMRQRLAECEKILGTVKAHHKTISQVYEDLLDQLKRNDHQSFHEKQMWRIGNQAINAATRAGK